MDKELLIKRIDDIILKGKYAISHQTDSSFGYFVETSLYSEWETLALSIVTDFSKYNDTFYKQFKVFTDSKMNYDSNIEQVKGILIALKKEIEYFQESNENIIINSEDILNNIFNKFHKSVHQLRVRYNNRPTIVINDIHDVQDYLLVLLKLFFEDINTEIWKPSYNEQKTKIDYILKNEKIIIVTKKTSKEFKNKEIIEQLNVDIQNYIRHSDCKRLFCFIYDPDELIENPRELEINLSKKEIIEIIVLVRP